MMVRNPQTIVPAPLFDAGASAPTSDQWSTHICKSALMLPNEKARRSLKLAERLRIPCPTVHRLVDVSDTVDGALAEAKVLAHHLSGNL